MQAATASERAGGRCSWGARANAAGEGATRDVTENGQTLAVDNDEYWEGVYKLIRSNLKLNANVEGQKTFLRQLHVKWLDNVGGRTWKKEFADLKQELIPDFDPKKVLESPATQP